MAVLIDALAGKFAITEPPLSVEAGIRQETQLDPKTNLALKDVAEMDAYIRERLDARESDCLMVLSNGKFAFPCPPELLALAWRNRTPEQRAAMLTYQLKTAAEALEKYVLGDLYLKASQRDPGTFLAKAVFYLGDKTTGRKGDADLTLERVAASVNAMGEEPGLEGKPSKALKTSLLNRGETTDSEYRRQEIDWRTPDLVFDGFGRSNPLDPLDSLNYGDGF